MSHVARALAPATGTGTGTTAAAEAVRWEITNGPGSDRLQAICGSGLCLGESGCREGPRLTDEVASLNRR